MTKRNSSLGQMMTILFLVLFPLGTERLPGQLAKAGAAAWICPLIAGAAVLGIAALVSRGESLDQGGLGRRIAGRWGNRAGQVFAVLFLLWGLFLTTAHAGRVGARLSDSLRASPVLLTAAVLLLAAWMAGRGVPAFARASEIFALAIGFGFFLIILFGVFRMRWDFVVLWDWGNLAQVPKGSLSAAGTLAVGCYALFLLDDVAPNPKGRRSWLIRLGGLFLLLTVAMILMLGRLGPALTGAIDRPFFQMVSGLGFEGAFQRLEELVSALWMLGDAALLGLLLLSLGRLLAQGIGKQKERGLRWLLAGVVFLGSLPVSFWSHVLTGPVLPTGNLIAGLGMVLLLLLTREKKKS